MKTPKQKVLKKHPKAFCRRQRVVHDTDGRYVVAAGPVEPRGSERAAIGRGATAAKAWASAL